MPKIVDKLQKRQKIAQSACDLFIDKGFVHLSISQIAKNAGIGKGTIYEYFTNKEDIVFELMIGLQDEYDPILQENLQSTDNLKQKMIYLFDIFLSEETRVIRQRGIFREFLAILLNNPTNEIKEFHTNMINKYASIVESIFKEFIEKKVIIPQSILMIPSIFASFEGFFVAGKSKEEIMQYLDNLCEILEVRCEE